MSEIIWLNGETMPLSDARIPVEDRGYQFADGVYEVIRFYRNRCFTLTEHLERLQRSADALRISLPLPLPTLAKAISDLVVKSGLTDGHIYLQLTRGTAPRAHAFPKDAKPNLLFHTRALTPVPTPDTVTPAKLITVPDERWHRCHIKTVALLANILAKQQAVEAGADEGVFLHNGQVTECCASNVFCVSGGRLITHPVGPKVLPGITRLVLREIAVKLEIPFVEKPLTLDEAKTSDEVFITSTIREVQWVSHWDGQPLATKVGPVARRLHQAYQQRVSAETHGV